MFNRKKTRGKEVFNKFFLREKYPSDEAFEAAIKERLRNPYWDYGKRKKATIRIIRNKRGARVLAYRVEENM